MAASIHKPEDINVNEIACAEPKMMGNGGKQVYLNYQGSKVVVQTPKMTLPWNMSFIMSTV